jgi:hypothetical protein
VFQKTVRRSLFGDSTGRCEIAESAFACRFLCFLLCVIESFRLAGTIQLPGWVERATGPCWRATRPPEVGCVRGTFWCVPFRHDSGRRVAARHSRVGCATQFN